MNPSNARTVVFQGLKIVYDSFGTGTDALVFIHGWTCNSSLWGKQEHLIRRHRSLLIDLPGHGRSDAPEMEYSQEFFARSIEAVIREEGVTNTVLVAHSMGGPVSTMLLRLFPQLVSGIVYVDSFFHSPETYLSEAERKELAERLREDFNFETAINRFWTGKTGPEIREKVLQTMLGTAKHVRVNAVTTNSLPHAFRRQDIFEIPALLIAVPQNAKIDTLWLHHMPKLGISIWENNSHFLFMEDPERFNAEVERFLVEHGFLREELVS